MHAHPLIVCAIFALSLNGVAQAHEDTCAATPSPARIAARQAYDEEPKQLDALLKLADALAADGCFDQAVQVLEDGEAVHGRNAELQSQLRELRSMLAEQKYFDALDRAGENAKLSRNVLRCKKLGDLQACDDALVLKPDDPEVIMAKGDALLQAGRPAEAMRTYSQAKTLAPDAAAVDEKIAAADEQRKLSLSECQHESGQSALQACDRALLRGDPGEFEILKRKGILLQAANQSSPALDAYISADLLKPGDRSVALAIVALSESTGRGDALTLTARGSSLLTLGRPAQALAPLRQALALSPGLAEPKLLLARAEHEAKEQRSKQAEMPSSPTQTAQVAATAPPVPTRRYSNAAPATKSN